MSSTMRTRTSSSSSILSDTKPALVGEEGESNITDALLSSSSQDGGETCKSSTPDTDERNGKNVVTAAVTSVEQSAAANSLNSFKLLLLFIMVLQNSAFVLVGRYTRSAAKDNGRQQQQQQQPKGEELYEVNHLIFICEVTKFFISASLECWTTKGHLLQSLQTHVLDRPLDALSIMVPAVLYLVQNTLLYVAFGNLTAPMFQVTYQARLVTTALVSVWMLNHVYSAQQWICLFGLSVGVAIVVLGEGGGTGDDEKEKQDTNSNAAATSTSTTSEPQNLLVGLVAVTIACFSSALAGVYFEKVLKKKQPSSSSSSSDKISVSSPPPASLWMRNMQLAFYSFVIAGLQGLYHPAANPTKRSIKAAAAAIGALDGAAAAPTYNNATQPYLHGFTAWVWILVGLHAGGGLLVAAVIKYADNVLKGLATGVSVVFATVLSVLLFDTKLSNQFSVGAALILVSVYIFSNPIHSLPRWLGGGGSSSSTKKEKDSCSTELKTLPK